MSTQAAKEQMIAAMIEIGCPRAVLAAVAQWLEDHAEVTEDGSTDEGGIIDRDVAVHVQQVRAAAERVREARNVIEVQS